MLVVIAQAPTRKPHDMGLEAREVDQEQSRGLLYWVLQLH